MNSILHTTKRLVLVARGVRVLILVPGIWRAPAS
jgi:hypothetical protein